MRTSRRNVRSSRASLVSAGSALVLSALLLGCSEGTALSETQSSGIPKAPAADLPLPAPSPVEEAKQTPVPTTSPDPSEVSLAWREGASLYDGGRYAEAARRLEVAALGRSDGYTHYLLGLALWKSGEDERAESALVRATELSEKSVRAWTNLARVRLDRDDPDGALEAADKALGLEPGSSSALHQRGRALAALGRADEALETLGRARESDPDNGYVANTFGWLLLQRGRASEAVLHLEAAAGRLPGVAYVRNNLAVAYERTGRIEEAVREYQAAVEAGDSDGKAALSLLRLAPHLPKTTTSLLEIPPCEDEVLDIAQGSGEVRPEEN